MTGSLRLPASKTVHVYYSSHTSYVHHGSHTSYVYYSSHTSYIDIWAWYNLVVTCEDGTSCEKPRNSIKVKNNQHTNAVYFYCAQWHHYGDITMETSLWRYHYGDITMETSPWRHHHGDITMETSLWRLWIHQYGDITMETALPRHYYERHHYGDMQTLRERWARGFAAALVCMCC